MKKFLVLGLILSSLTFAQGEVKDNTQILNSCDQNIKMIPVNSITPEQQKIIDDSRKTLQKAIEPLSISVQQKDLEIKKELLNDKKDWTKIESLEKDKYALASQIETLTLKNRVDLQDKLGPDFFEKMNKGPRLSNSDFSGNIVVTF